MWNRLKSLNSSLWRQIYLSSATLGCSLCSAGRKKCRLEARKCRKTKSGDEPTSLPDSLSRPIHHADLFPPLLPSPPTPLLFTPSISPHFPTLPPNLIWGFSQWEEPPPLQQPLLPFLALFRGKIYSFIPPPFHFLSSQTAFFTGFRRVGWGRVICRFAFPRNYRLIMLYRISTAFVDVF